MRSVAPKLTVAFVALLVALLIAELTVRIARLAPEVAVLDFGRYRLSANPRIGYEPVPGVSFTKAVPASVFEGKKTEDERDLEKARWINNQHFDYRESGNALGYRDYDHDVAKPAGRYRVVVLGDSVAAGLFTADYVQTFPAVLERELKATGKDAEVISFAVNGYNTQQEVETFADRGLVYRPDEVVVAYCHNDRRQVDGGMLKKLIEANGVRASGSTFSGWLVRHSALARLLWFHLWRPKKPLPEIYRSLEKDTVEDSLARLAALGKEHGFSVTLVVFPTFGFDFTKETAVMQSVAERLGFRYVDLLPSFQDCQKTGARPNIDRWHLKPAGHACSGKAVAEFLSR